MSNKRLHTHFLAATVLWATLLVGAPAASAASEVPPQLAGKWTIPWQGGTEYLFLADSRYMFFFNEPRKPPATGNLAVTGNTITFYSSNYCSGTGTYLWSLSDSGLAFVPLTSDPCSRAAILPSGTWTRP